MSKRMSDLIDTYRDAVSDRVAFNSTEHRAAETAARKALLGQSQAVNVAAITDEMIEAGAHVHNPFAFEVDETGHFVASTIHRDEACKEVRLILGAVLSPQATVAEGK